MLAIAITFFSKVYQQGSQFASNSGAFLSSRFSIPAGHLSFEVALRWGGQQQQPRRDEESRGGEDQ